MVLRAGRMRHTLTLQRRATTKDAMGQQVNTWTDVGTYVASVEPVRGREYLGASGEHSDVTHRIFTRARSDMSPKPYDRFAFGSRYFNVKSVMDLAERGDQLEIMVVEEISTAA